MSYVDIALSAILVVALVRGYSRGFIIEVFSILSFVIGVFIAIHFSEPIAKVFFSDSEFFPVIYIVVFIVLFLIVSLVTGLIARVLKSSVKLVFLGWLDKLLGATFSLLKWVIILSIFLWISTSSGIISSSKELKSSRIYTFIEFIGPESYLWIREFILKDLNNPEDVFKNRKVA